MNEFTQYELRHNFSFNLRNRLDELDLKQYELARLCGVNKSTISKYYCGMMFPSNEHLLAIGRILDMSVSELLAPIDISQQRDDWVGVEDHPTYEINRDKEIRNNRTGRILKTQYDDKNRPIVRLDRKTEKIHKLYKKAFD